MGSHFKPRGFRLFTNLPYNPSIRPQMVSNPTTIEQNTKNRHKQRQKTVKINSVSPRLRAFYLLEHGSLPVYFLHLLFCTLPHASTAYHGFGMTLLSVWIGKN